jgi:hypothetical protein
MNKMFGVMLSAALLCSSAAMAKTTDAPCDTQLHAQISALQAQVTQLQENSNVQQSDSIVGYQLPSGG